MLKEDLVSALAAWSKTHGCRRKELTTNCPTELGIQVVALERSAFEGDYYIRFGIWLGASDRFVREPECHIRLHVEGPWGRKPAIESNSHLGETEVVEILDRFVVPLMERTRTLERLESFRAAGELQGAAILIEAREKLGWPTTE